MGHSNLRVFLLALSLFVFTGSALAAEADGPPRHTGQDGDWTVRIGAMGLYKPEYEGSDDYSAKGLPLIDISWRDTFFFNPRKGLGAYVMKRKNIKLALAVGYTFGRDENDSSDLDGLGDIDGGATANALLEYSLKGFSLNTRYEKQITGESTGAQVHFSLGYMLRATGQLMLRPSIKTSYASPEYMDTFFGINSNQATNSGLSTYNPSSGFKSIGLNILAIYRLSRSWGVQVMGGYERLVGDAADSPVVKDKNQYLAGAGLSYTF